MKKANRPIESPDLPQQLETTELNTLEDASEIEMVQIDIIAPGIEAEHVRFQESYIKGVHFDAAKLPHSSWVDVIFENCDLSNVKLTNTQMNRVEFRNCKLVGTDFDRADLRDVRMIDCQAPYTLFNLTNMQDVAFSDCLLKSANFIESEFFNVQFGSSTIDDVQFTGTSLKDVDLSNCELRQIHIQKEDIEGAIVSADQAISLIELFGVTVKD
ncbi:pentapeptide repeat-containing protein [Allobacillus sp. SKP2-8]|uniref:pentapeptide repeat-containing protein n=1 Tax=unclassified Allobacillus TaxID=2628859 RepID=UPI001182BF71|nr:pentapeptide repeat-containing protein [Allobacillus sp. SKP2-8]TSJ65719.1 pentapeptide repeat-containing protein [Allobacillus sp. SKP2-8]